MIASRIDIARLARRHYGYIGGALLAGSAVLAGPALAAPATPASTNTQSACDRACLKAITNTFFDAIVHKREGEVPLSHIYQATENGVASSPSSMTIWRTVDAIRSRFLIVDPVSSQVYAITTVDEGGKENILFGRLKVENRQISEIELYTNRTRGQDGVTYTQGGSPTPLPVEWTQTVAKNRLPSRDELLTAGRSKFDNSFSPPPGSPDCMLMEQGKFVAEHPKVWAAIGPAVVPGKPTPQKAGKAYVRNADGTVPIPCSGGSPKRPQDPNARVDIIDEEQGIVVTRGTIHQAHVLPYHVTNPTESVEVPDSLTDDAPALESLKGSGGTALPSLRPTPVTSFSSAVYRIYDGKIQGMMLMFYLVPAGSQNPFMAPRISDSQK
ncbi:MAG: hypothetical protein AB7E05_15725 [Sphingobium sp.]